MCNFHKIGLMFLEKDEDNKEDNKKEKVLSKFEKD